MPSIPMGPVYTEPDLDMELLVFKRGYEPGRATLRTLRSYSANVEAGLDDRLRTETQQRKDADTVLGQRIDAEAFTRAQADAAEASARQSADTALGQRITEEATARQNADTQEAQTRASADTALGNRLTTVESKLPRTAILTYSGADLTWAYPTAFAAGVVPVIEAVVETAANSTALFNCQLVGPPTNTAVKIRINTIPAASVSLLGLASLTLFQQAPSGVKLHVTARIPQ